MSHSAHFRNSLPAVELDADESDNSITFPPTFLEWDGWATDHSTSTHQYVSTPEGGYLSFNYLIV